MDETTMLHGVRCTTPTRTCFDGMRLAQDLTEAVVFGDMLLAAGLARLPAPCQYVSARRRWRGVPQARAALDLMTADTRGPWESRLRMTWVLEACLPTPLVNVPVFGRDGHLIGIPDLFDPEAAVAWEFDGGGHREARQHADDNVREEKLEDAGILVGRASALDLLHEHRRRDLSQRMRRARVRGLRRNPLADGWTLRTPERHWLGDARGALIEMLLELEPEPHRT